MKTCAVIRHLAFEDLDLLQPVLELAGFTWRYVDAPVQSPADLDALSDDLVVVLGGPIGVCDEADFPFLAEATALLRRRLAADRPTLGICLGAQLMAHALGARVHPNPAGREIGWAAVQLTDAGRDGVLGEIGGSAVLHWHGDTFDLPPGAKLLASTAKTPHQAFSWGRNGLALQFHVEASARGLERWYVGHVGEISACPDISVSALRGQAAVHAPNMEKIAPALFAAWLDQVCA